MVAARAGEAWEMKSLCSMVIVSVSEVLEVYTVIWLRNITELHTKMWLKMVILCYHNLKNKTCYRKTRFQNARDYSKIPTPVKAKLIVFLKTRCNQSVCGTDWE